MTCWQDLRKVWELPKKRLVMGRTIRMAPVRVRVRRG